MTSASINWFCQVLNSAGITACRHRLRRYQCVFKGCELVDWLLQAGLSTDRSAAVEYASTLLEGRVIEHVQRRHYFYDLPYLYRFTS